MAKASKYSKRHRESKGKPFVLEFGEEDPREDIVIPKPGATALMNAEESGTTRGFLQHMAGDKYDDLMDYVDDELEADGLVELVRDITSHFGVSPDQVPEGKRRR